MLFNSHFLFYNNVFTDTNVFFFNNLYACLFYSYNNIEAYFWKNTQEDRIYCCRF